MADEQIVTNIVATSDFSSLIADVQRTTASLSKLQQQLTLTNKTLASQAGQIQKAFGDTLRSTGQFTSHFVTVGSEVEKFGKNLDAGKLKLRDYFQTWQNHTKTSGGLIRELAKQQVTLQNAIVQPLGKSADGLQKFNVHVANGLDLTKNKTALARKEMQIYNKVIQDGGVQLINWGKNTQWAGRQLTVGLTVPIAAFGAAAAKAFKEADQELVRLQKVYGGLAATSTQELAKIRKDVSATAKELSAAYGSSYKETISLAADLAATGKQGNELLLATKEATRLSVLGEVDRQEAMKATLAIQSAFKQNTTQLSESINFLNAVENQTSTSLADLVEAIPKAGPVVKALGGDVQDLALYLTAMREGGVNASEGANALKSALASIINPTKVAREMFQGFGIDLGGIVTKNAGNLTGTILSIQKALDTLNPLQKSQAIEQLFGKFQFARMNALFENLGKQGSQTLQVLDLMKASSQDLANVASRELSQITESASGKYKRAVESLKAELASLGDQFLKVGTFFIKVVDGLLKFINAMPGPVKSLLGILGGITALAGPLIMLTGVFANFIGYVVKAIGHIRALGKGGEGFRLLTPEILAAQKAGSLIEKTFYSDAAAAEVLKGALSNLVAEYTILEQKANAGAISAQPLISTLQGNTIMQGAGRVADPTNPLIGKPYSRQMSHLNPVAGMTTEEKAAQTIFGVVPGPGPVNQRIGKNPQVYSTGDLPNIEGVTSINKVSTGIVAEEAAKWHSMTAAIAMQSESEIKLLKAEIAATGTITSELSGSYQALLPQMSSITTMAAQEAKLIVAELEASKISVDQARSKIIALNAQVEAMMVQTASAVATSQGRTINVNAVPLTGQPVVDPVSGKTNMKEMFHKSKTSQIVDKVARALGVRTSGGGYSVHTTKPRRFRNGVTSAGMPMQQYAGGVVGAGVKSAQLLRAYFSSRSKIGGIRTPAKPGSSHGPTPIGASEAGVEVPYGKIYKKGSPFYKDKDNIAWELTPANADDVLMHAAVPPFVSKTSGLQSGRYSTPHGPMDDIRGMGVSTTSKKDIGIVLPNELVKNTGKFNTNLGNGSFEGWRPVNFKDMFGLLTFLKQQGMPKMKAFELASRSARNLNAYMEKHIASGQPITEEIFGKYVYRANQKAIVSSFSRASSKPKQRDPFRNDPFWDRGGKAEGPSGYKDGVTQVPGYGGGDIIPALIEPGESVVTKEATARYAPLITAMNEGNVPGFKKGATGIGSQEGSTGIGSQVGMIGGSIGGQMLGNAVAGPVGGIVGSIAGGFLPQLLGMLKSRELMTAAQIFTKTNIAIGATVATVGLLYAAYKKHNEEVKLTALGYGLTEEAASKAGLKYTDLNKNLKEAIANNKALLERNKMLYASVTSSGTPLKMTIAEYRKLQEEVKSTMPEIIKMINQSKTKDVGDVAIRLKTMFMQAGDAADEATKKTYALIAASNKNGKAASAISGKEFSSIQSLDTAAAFSVRSFADAQSTGNSKASYQALETAINGINAGIDDIVKKSKENITYQEAVAQQFEKINDLSVKKTLLDVKTLAEIRKQWPELGKILNTSDSIKSVWQKYQLVLQGTKVDLSLLSDQGVDALYKMNAAIDTATQNSLNKSGGPLASTFKLLEDYRKKESALNKASAGASAKQQIDSRKQIEALQKEIKLIQDKANARKQALREELTDSNAKLQIQKKQLEYQDAIAVGDMSRAAQAQLDIKQISGEQQQVLAERSIDKNAESKIAPLQKQIDALNAKNQKIADNASLAGSALGNITPKAEALANALDAYSTQIKTIVKDLKSGNLTGQQQKEAYAAAYTLFKDLQKQNPSLQFPEGVKTTRINKDGKTVSLSPEEIGKQLVDPIVKLVDSNEKVATLLEKFYKDKVFGEILKPSAGATATVGPDLRTIKLKPTVKKPTAPIYNPYPRRENGGGVSAGLPYLVGEDGPEIFSPSVAGDIISNRKINSPSYNIPKGSVSVANNPFGGYNNGGTHKYDVGGIVINAAPGMDERALARYAIQEMQKINAQAFAAKGSPGMRNK